MSFAWALEVVRGDGTVASRTPLSPDWGAASGWVRFQGIRRGVLPPLLNGDEPEVEPVWDAERGAPYVAAVRITIRPAAGAAREPVREEVPLACLAGQIADVLRALVQDGCLAQGELVRPKLRAYREVLRAGRRDPASSGGMGIEELPVALRLRDTAIAPFLDAAIPREVDGAADDVPVFIPAHVLAEAEALARETPDVESGGFLLGHLHRDAAVRECFVEVTAQIPGRHTIAERARLTFTPDTWAAADAERRARRRDEDVVAWFHVHPFLCRPCPPERRRVCSLGSAFFSGEDVRLHALGFGQAYKVALVLSERESGALGRSLYGWRRGVVVARGYHEIVAAPRPLEETTT